MVYLGKLKFGVLFLVALAATYAEGAVFTSADKVFTLDMPAGWTQTKNTSAPTVLSLQKETATIDIKKINCTSEKCLDEKINQDLVEVKAKKMTVITNTYTGEEIKRIEFSTGEPIYYISFFTLKNDFSSGYFLMNEHAYSVLAKNITYAEADLIFSFFSPLRPENEPQQTLDLGFVVDHASPKSYETDALPEVEDVELTPITVADASAPETKPAKTGANPSALKKHLHRLKNKLAKVHIKTLVSRQMPPYLRRLGHGFDVGVLLILLFAGLWSTAFVLRLIIRPDTQEEQANPHSLYPIKVTRLYGTPALIFRAKDNQGNVLISLGNRWNSIFIFMGLMLILITILTLAATSLLEQTQFIKLSNFVYSTLYAGGALVIPLGILLILCGILWGMVSLREITLFDRKGKKAAIIAQKGISLLREQYNIYFARSKDVLHVERKRFVWKRTWLLTNETGDTVATFTEKNGWISLARRCVGHLCGFLRADYVIEGPMDSQGVLQNTHALFNALICNMDKPEALPARDALALSVLISMRDHDKWYPWFN